MQIRQTQAVAEAVRSISEEARLIQPFSTTSQVSDDFASAEGAW